MRVSIFCVALALLASTAARADYDANVQEITFRSSSLSAFWGAAVDMHAFVVLPESYAAHPERRYPVIYVVPAFDGDYRMTPQTANAWEARMRAVGAEFIVVSLQGMYDFNGETLHQEYADSENDGPWGSALTSEFVPEIDAHLRTIPAAGGRFLFGHSSGGWSVLWLQTNYPGIFGGAWALSPDPVDFHDFGGPDLTASQNFYYDSAGNAYGIDRDGTRDLSTIANYVNTKAWMKRQVDTWEEVFSPRMADGSAAHLFDRKTGAIDAAVAAYWEQHYDITRLLRARWSTVGPQLNGKIHVYVGAADTFHLDGAVRLLQTTLDELGATAEVELAPGDDHWQIYSLHSGMIAYAMSEMKAALATPAAR